MRKLLLSLLALCMLPALANTQQLVEGFNSVPTDTNYWFVEAVASSDTSGVLLTYTDAQKVEGDSALRVDWTVQASETWGGFTNLMHMAPDSSVFDFSLATHLSLWYYVESKSSQPSTVEFRILLKDVSDAPHDLTEITQAEFWYSHHQILEADPGWNELLVPLEDVGNLTFSQGFWLPGWAGAPGNGELDLDQIKAFKFEFSIDGSLHNAGNPSESGVAVGRIYLDNFRAVGHRNPVLNFFDTTATATNFEITGTGTSTLAITDNVPEAFEDAAAQFDWKIDADQSFGGFVAVRFDAEPGTFQPDMSGFSHLSLRYNNKVPSSIPGNVVFRVQLHEYSEGDDQQELWFYETNAILDDSVGGWKQLLIPLEDRGMGVFPNDEGFSNPGWGGVQGNSKLDWDKVRSYEIAFSAAQQGTITEGTLLLDNLELYGFRETDLTPPAQVQGIDAIPDTDNYFNLVIWQDVPGETNEKYDVFASLNPITDVNAPHVEQIGFGIARGQQTLTHFLVYPLEDKELSYYYAVRAVDKAGNIGQLGTTSGPITNKARGVATISLNPPANFAADGDLTEWQNSGIMPFVFKPSTSHIGTGSFDNDDDLTATVYLAVDNQYLYLAADVIDNIYSYDPAGNWWEDDVLEMFIGLYDSRKGQHGGMGRGEEPDYKLQIRSDQLVNEFNGNQVIFTPDSADYYFEGFNPDYVVETRIPLAAIQFGDDKPFVPENGMRIPFDMVVHDSDAPNVRDGILTYSPRNMDNSWRSPRNWSYTFVGNQFVTPVEEQPGNALPRAYELSQNYPNPFNPTTTIRYALPKAGHVKIVLFNALGQKVMTLVDAQKPAGTFTVQLDGSALSSGLYFYQISVNDFKQSKKLVLMK